MLTAPQLAMLKSIARVVDNYDGLAPYGASQWNVMHSLENKGLVKLVALGECGDDCERAGDCPHSVSIFTLTDKGHDVIDADNYDGPKDGEAWSGGFAENH